jgi:glycerol-3-phosphate dehydrogenase (NAD(P)+)
MRVTVLGAGSWGTTLAVLLHTNGHRITLWGHRAEHTNAIKKYHENKRLLPGIQIPSDIVITHELDEAITNAEVVVTAVPSQYLRSALEQLKTHNFQQTIFVNVAKGIENGSLMTMSEVILDVLPSVKKENIATLSGPSFAEEVARKVPTAVVAASSAIQTAKLVQQLFLTQWFRVYSSNDLRGVELGGSVKNVIAIGAGIADGAGFGDNTKAAIMTRATAEIARLGKMMGANPVTFTGLSGIGDLIVTCLSKHSRNRRVGEEIGKGRTLSDVLEEMVMVAEGVATTKSVCELGKHYNVDLPIVNEVYQVLFEEKNPVEATYDLMTRDAKEEH